MPRRKSKLPPETVRVAKAARGIPSRDRKTANPQPPVPRRARAGPRTTRQIPQPRAVRPGSPAAKRPPLSGVKRFMMARPSSSCWSMSSRRNNNSRTRVALLRRELSRATRIPPPPTLASPCPVNPRRKTRRRQRAGHPKRRALKTRRALPRNPRIPVQTTRRRVPIRLLRSRLLPVNPRPPRATRPRHLRMLQLPPIPREIQNRKPARLKMPRNRLATRRLAVRRVRPVPRPRVPRSRPVRHRSPTRRRTVPRDRIAQASKRTAVSRTARTNRAPVRVRPSRRAADPGSRHRKAAIRARRNAAGRKAVKILQRPMPRPIRPREAVTRGPAPAALPNLATIRPPTPTRKQSRPTGVTCRTRPAASRRARTRQEAETLTQKAPRRSAPRRRATRAASSQSRTSGTTAARTRRARRKPNPRDNLPNNRRLRTKEGRVSSLADRAPVHRKAEAFPTTPGPAALSGRPMSRTATRPISSTRARPPIWSWNDFRTSRKSPMQSC